MSYRTPHYIEPLKTTRIPANHTIFDCETRGSKRHGRYAHRWVTGALAHGELDTDGFWGASYASLFASPSLMWGEICDAADQYPYVVVWAHNLAFDLRVSEALRWIPANGYALEAIVLERTAAWAGFTSGRTRLTVCDLYSWLPVPLTRIAADLGKALPKVKYGMESDRDLEGQCLTDVEVTAEAVGQVLEWLHREQCGSFRPTGAGQSHSMWRRRFLTPKTVLVHNDVQALERERAAMHTGRAEAWRWGEVTGPLYEHDLSLAYCRIAATADVPVKLIRHSGSISVERYRRELKQGAIMADVTVTTNSEIVPTLLDERELWPVGEFDTTLWNPEIDLLLVSGARVDIHRAWYYRTAPALAPMARYLIELLENDGAEVSSVVRRLLKHWARTLVGRCALRYRSWEEFGTVPVTGLSLSTMVDWDTGTMTELLHIGKRIFELADMAESDLSVPQITGWVMSMARANLWVIMVNVGLEHLAYVDTDCVIVNGEGHRRLMQWNTKGDPGILVHKATYGKARIYGPRNIVLEDERRLSGVPRRAVQNGELHFEGEVWEGLRTSLESHHPDTVSVTPRSFDVDDIDPRRQRIEGGGTQPYRMGNNATLQVYGRRIE